METGGAVEVVGPPWLVRIGRLKVMQMTDAHARRPVLAARGRRCGARRPVPVASAEYSAARAERPRSRVQANAELTRHGLTPVLIPTPGTAPDSQALAAASTATVAAMSNRSALTNEPQYARRRLASSLVGRVAGPDLSLPTGFQFRSASSADPSGGPGLPALTEPAGYREPDQRPDDY